MQCRRRLGAFFTVQHFRCLFSTSNPNPPKTLVIPPKFPPESDVETIRSLLASNSPVAVADLDVLLKNFTHNLDSSLVLSILKCYRDLGRSKTLTFFSWAGFRLGFRLDDDLVEYMVDFLGRRKLFDDVKGLLKTVKESNGRVSTRAISICIRFLGRQGRVRDALDLFESMEIEFNCVPDNLVFNNVLYVLCKRDSSGDYIDAALEIFGRIGQPDVYSYSNVIIGLCRFGRLRDAYDVFVKMGRISLVPTRTAANVLVGHLCQLGNRNELVEKVSIRDWRRPFDILVPNLEANSGLDPAVEVFWVLLDLGMLPSMYVVNALIAKLCRVGKIDEAMKILKLIDRRKLNFNDESYCTLIKAFCDSRRMEEAVDFFESITSLGHKPKLVVYNALIRAFCKMGNICAAHKYFEIMNKNRCEPDCTTYTMLIHVNCTAKNWEAAYQLLIEMVGLGWRPHFDTYKLVDCFLKENGMVDLSAKLDRKMEIQDLYSHCKAGRLEAAYNKFNLMIARGLHPPIYVRDAFEQAFQRVGKRKVAQELLRNLEKSIPMNDAQGVLS